jgi:hypothetical protein
MADPLRSPWTLLVLTVCVLTPLAVLTPEDAL